MKKIFVMFICSAAVLVYGDSVPKKSDLTALQGEWKGRVIQDNQDHTCDFVISGNNFEFHDKSDTNVWYKGTFTLREETTPKQYIAVISDCPFPEYNGKTSMSIYRIENGTLTIAASEPNNPDAPLTFDAPDVARMEVKKK